MEVKINNSIDIQTPVKKKRTRIGEYVKNSSSVTEDSSTFVKSTNFKRTDSSEKKSKDFSGKKKFTNRKPSRSVNDIKEGIVKSLETTGGKYVKFDDINHTEGILVCGVIDADNPDNCTDNDICFAVINHNRTLVYVNCNERFAVMREPSMKCSILDWLYRNETSTITEAAKETLNYDGVHIFTNVYLMEPPVEKPKSNKKNKKNKKPAKKS